ncbi:MAG: hypothetical protein ACI4P6_07025 [Candidatus Spyradosoma sp.]
MKMKKLFSALLIFAVALGVPAFAAPKKGAAAADETSPALWTKQTKVYLGKTVSTYVADVGAAGYATSDAPFVVVPIETATEKNDKNGKIYALIPFGAFEGFADAYAPQREAGGSAFGKRAVLKKISGVFAIHKKEPVLLVGVPAAKLANAPAASALLEKQLAADAENSGANAASRPGYVKKIFSVGAVGKNAKLKTEFNRLVGLYNKDKKGADKMKPDQMRAVLEDDGDPYTVFDEAKKIEWEIRK